MKNYSEINEEFLIRYFEGRATNDEIKLLSDWLDQKESNKHDFAALKKSYIEITANIQKDSIVANKAFERFQQKIHQSQKPEKNWIMKKDISVYYKFFRYAAIILMFITVGLCSYYIGKAPYKNIKNSICEITVPYGGKSDVKLPDGTHIWLNAGSKIKYNKDFNNEKREVMLEGEAYFEVKKSRIPFIVCTSHLNVYVLGTKFNVKSYPEEDNIEATLVEGSIRVLTEKSCKPIYLEPNQKLTYHKQQAISDISGNQEESNKDQNSDKNSLNETITINKNINTTETTSWKTGSLVLNNVPLKELTIKLQRKYNVNFEFESEELKNYSYSGTLRDFPIEQVLKALKFTSPIEYSINENTVVLYLNKKYKPIYDEVIK